MTKIEKEVAELLIEGLASMGVLDDWDEYVIYHSDEIGPKATMKKAEMVGRVVDWMNKRLPKSERVSPGKNFVKDAKEYLEEMEE